MSWRYENRSLKNIHSLMNDTEHNHQDLAILRIIAKKAYSVGKFFEENEMNEEFIVKYLDDKLSCDALCELHLVSSVLYPQKVEVEDRIFSYSHKQWLNKLTHTKLHWTWKEVNIDLNETQSKKLEMILDSYKELQELALSYKD